MINIESHGLQIGNEDMIKIVKLKLAKYPLSVIP